MLKQGTHEHWIGLPTSAHLKTLEGVNDNGVEAVGLIVQNSVYGFSRLPTEDDQYAYSASLEGMNGKPVVVRTMDIGGDKELYFDLPKEMNPFLS